MARARIVRFALIAAALAALLIFSTTSLAHAQSQSQPTVQPAASDPSVSPNSTPTASTSPATSHSSHSVTVTFNYDFGQTPACSKKVTTHCVQQFIAYDISAGPKHATMLFPIPLPSNPVSAVKGITKTSQPLDFESGKHLISVAAMSPDGTHSKRSLCTTWITIP
jgi:hypothetical protein